MSEASAIALRGVRKTFGKRVALAELDLQVATGTIHGFVGPNGAGKSTALRLLVGLLRADAGSVQVLGLDPARHGLAVRRRACYLPGETSVYGHLTGGDFLTFALSFYPRLDAALQRDLAEAWPLPLQQKVRTYSAGMKQKLALMACLVPDVELYVLDEPDRALDANARLFLREVLRRPHADGKTLLLSSHHLSEVEALTRELTFVVEGRRIARERVDAARHALRRVLRLRLREPELRLPPGVVEQRLESDGTLRLELSTEPLAWLQQLPANALDSVEIGATRLDDLYRQLCVQADSP